MFEKSRQTCKNVKWDYIASKNYTNFLIEIGMSVIKMKLVVSFQLDLKNNQKLFD